MTNLNTLLKLIACLAIISLAKTPSLGQGQKHIEIKGIYGNPAPLWERGYDLQDLGVNAIFVHSGAINSSMMAKARAQGVKVFAEFATLNGKNYVDEHPEAWAVDEKGEQVKPADWFMGVCPTEPGFRQFRLDQLLELLQKFDLDVVWMDYQHWHAQFETPEPILPETCFNAPCLTRFSGDTGIEIPNGTTAEKAQWILEHHDVRWRAWRCQIILEWVKEFKAIINKIKPNALLGVYHCPWQDEDYDHAHRRMLGLDYDLLKAQVDVFSPMVYHARMGRDATWVKENVEWFGKRLSIQPGSFPKVWPIVQAHNDPKEISPEEFLTVLKGGLSGSATGVMMFTTRALAEDKGKIEVMRQVYKNLSQEE